jgi:hypothetical protein
MAKVKLGSEKFDVNSQEINARGCGVTAADCVALAARMKSGEMRRLKKLYLVRLFSVLFQFCRIPPISTSHPHYFTGRQLHWRRRCARHCRRDAYQQQFARAVPCAYVMHVCFRSISVLSDSPHLHFSSALFHSAAMTSATTVRAPFSTRCAPTAVCESWTLCVCVVAKL